MYAWEIYSVRKKRRKKIALLVLQKWSSKPRIENILRTELYTGFKTGDDVRILTNKGEPSEMVKRGAPWKEEIESNGERDRRHGRRTLYSSQGPLPTSLAGVGPKNQKVANSGTPLLDLVGYQWHQAAEDVCDNSQAPHPVPKGKDFASLLVFNKDDYV